MKIVRDLRNGCSDNGLQPRYEKNVLRKSWESGAYLIERGKEHAESDGRRDDEQTSACSILGQ